MRVNASARLVGLGLVTLLSLAGVAAAEGDLRVVKAVRNRDRAALRVLLKERINVNTPEADGTTALHWVAQWNDLETTDLLIQAGAKVDAATDHGITPLWLACKVGSTAVVE